MMTVRGRLRKDRLFPNMVRMHDDGGLPDDRGLDE